MQRIEFLRRAAASAAALLLLATVVGAGEPHTRRFDLSWTIQVEGIPEGTREARVWIAVPQDLPEQRVSSLSVKTDLASKFVEDPTFHNKVAVVTVPQPAASITISVQAEVRRDAVDGPRAAKLGKADRSLYLRQESLVQLSPHVRALADSIRDTSRARYDYVLAAMEYDKTVPGWGRGDVQRACEVGKGNCTDFHSFFMALSRSKGVPAVFEMGYSTLPEGETNRAGGYHCWAWFYEDARRAWIPVDISEADKHPEKAEYFFGNLDAERITFSRGREITLPGMKGAPLNFLPAGAYVELDGKPLEAGITRTLSYVVDDKPAAARH